MADSSGDWKDLSERLNKLKKGTWRETPDVAESPAKDHQPSRVSVPLNSPPTAHDILSDRLKLLRLQDEHDAGGADREKPSKSGPLSNHPTSPRPSSRKPITDPLSQKRDDKTGQKHEVKTPAGEALPKGPPHLVLAEPPGDHGRTDVSVSSTQVEPSPSIEASLKWSMDEPLVTPSDSKHVETGIDDPDSFLASDDQTLEELLADLELDAVENPEPPEWLLPAFPQSRARQDTRSPSDTTPKELPQRGDKDQGSESEDDPTPREILPGADIDLHSLRNPAAPEPSPERIEALLKELSERSMPEGDDKEETSKEDHEDSDDSDGEVMKAEVDQMVEQAQDEAQLGPTESPQGETLAPEPSDISLPEPPSSDSLSTPQSKLNPTMEFEARMAALATPSPSAAENPAVSKPANPDAVVPGFASRLESLRALRSSSGINLPDTPSNAPGPTGWKKTKYTDEDMETWCTVCLEDATLICTGCDDEPYCERCWTEMHRGPMANYDDMGHKAEILERGRKKKGKEKRVLVGAS